MSRFYVYHLVDPRDGEVFYVGKGQRTRGSDHLKEAVSPAKGSKHPKDKRIREILAADQDARVEVVERFALEADALDFERREIARIGLKNLTNVMAGYESAKARAEKLNSENAAGKSGPFDKALTPKQERFAQKYIETGNATQAYYDAYDAAGSKPITANRKAKELLDNGKVAARVRELQAHHLKRHEVTVDSLVGELEEARRLALGISQPAAAVSATMGKAKITGKIVDKSEHSGPDGGPIVTEDRTDLETARRIAFLLSSAGRKAPG